MYSQEYEFTAVHEAGHAVCAEQFPPEPVVSTPLPFPPLESPSSRIREIIFGYDEALERFDSITVCGSSGLSDEQLFFKALGGRVAELMARTEGNWDSVAIQTSILSGEYDDTQDMEDVSNLLSTIPENQREQVLTETVSIVFSFLEGNWDLVIQVATDLLN